jgi:hypothetical protein
MTNSTKATRATVTIGPLTVDGFMLPDGSYQMSQAQAADAIGKESPKGSAGSMNPVKKLRSDQTMATSTDGSKQDYRLWLENPFIPSEMGSGWQHILDELSWQQHYYTVKLLNEDRQSQLGDTATRARLLIVGLIAEIKCKDFRLLGLKRSLRQEMVLAAEVWIRCRQIVMELCFDCPDCPLPLPLASAPEVLCKIILEGTLVPPNCYHISGLKPGQEALLEQLKKQNSALRSPEDYEGLAAELGVYSWYLMRWAHWKAGNDRKFELEAFKPFIKARSAYIQCLRKDIGCYHAEINGIKLSRQGRRKAAP